MHQHVSPTTDPPAFSLRGPPQRQTVARTGSGEAEGLENIRLLPLLECSGDLLSGPTMRGMGLSIGAT